MDTELLKTFLEVQKTRHFGKAAENLYLTQSAVSFRVRQLEQSLGVILFSRFRNNIQLTAAGELLLPHAQAVLAAIQTAKQQLNQQYHLQKNRKMLLSAGLAALLPAKQLNSLFLPQQYWQVHSLASDDNKANWHDYEAVVYIGAPKSELAPLEGLCLGYIHWWPVSAAEVVQLQHECAVQQHTAMPRLTAEPLNFSSSDPRLVCQWLQQHKACAYLPSVLVQTAVEQGKMRKLSQATVQQSVWAYSQPGEQWPEQWRLALQSCGVLHSPL
ncbi:LysR family transcriptional regulator [Rheinheimera sp.]|uniref:LysR family transcriptional regulator n=1 Tax=Rheinheimera sp. TaxID=1869214 RepID=UPI0027B9C5CF|nr:LysR family transcriptional regulator [Rheinheimera sp.]